MNPTFTLVINAEIEFLRINNVDTCVRHFVPYKDMEYVHVNDGKEEEFDGLVLGIDDNFIDIIDIKKYIHFNVT